MRNKYIYIINIFKYLNIQFCKYQIKYVQKLFYFNKNIWKKNILYKKNKNEIAISNSYKDII